MRRLMLTCAAIAVFASGVLSWSSGPGVRADDGGVDKTTIPEGPVITAVVTGPGSSVPGTPATTVVIPCGWYAYGADADDAEGLNSAYGSIIKIVSSIVGKSFRVTITFFSQDGILHRWNEGDTEFEQHQIADCTGATDPGGVTTGDGRWVVVGPPDPAILLPDTTKRATEPIDPPTPTLSPATRAPVNLGLWLSVDPAGPIVARADLGPLWAETTATMVTTSFDLGAGDPPIVCAGHGTPIPESRKDSIEQGPCGYTYRADTDDDTVDITITTTWTVTWELSDGRTGNEPDIVMTSVLPYEVYEIQTIGTAG